MSAEARVHPRLRVLARADVIGTEVVLARPVEDISLGGCKVSGPCSETKGTAVQLVLTFPSLAAHLPLSGTVVRVDGSMGIRFAELSEEQKSSLRRYMRELSQGGGT